MIILWSRSLSPLQTREVLASHHLVADEFCAGRLQWLCCLAIGGLGKPGVFMGKPGVFMGKPGVFMGLDMI